MLKFVKEYPFAAFVAVVALILLAALVQVVYFG